MKRKVLIIIALCIFLTGLFYGCVEEEKEEENKSPTCGLTANPTSGTTPLTVTFTITASDSDGSISSWELDINNDGLVDYQGIGNPPTTQMHTYEIAGSYTAKLYVTDNEGALCIKTVWVSVSSPQYITVTINNNMDYGAAIIIFDGKGTAQTMIYSEYIEWGETEVFNSNLTGSHDFKVMVTESQYGFQSSDTITTDKHFVVNIEEYGTINITSNG